MSKSVPKIIRQVAYYRPALQQQTHYTEIEIEETTKVRKHWVTNPHLYWVPAGVDLEDPDGYLEPLEDPDLNIRRDWSRYREIYQILTPAAIKANRERYQLSGREYALILGISHSSLSELENGLVLQSDEQDSLLTMAANQTAFYQLLRRRQAIFTTVFSDQKYAAILKRVEGMVTSKPN